jgi:hypothetical protein
MQQVKKVVAKNTGIDGRIEDILIQQFRINDREQDPGYKAYACMAVEVGMAFTNIFLALKDPTAGRSYRGFCDLTYQLAQNDFWQKNASVILPVVHMALNAYRDGVSLSLERSEYGVHDNLIAAARCAPLELYPLLAYLVGGPGLMVSTSIPLKNELAPYFL